MSRRQRQRLIDKLPGEGNRRLQIVFRRHEPAADSPAANDAFFEVLWKELGKEMGSSLRIEPCVRRDEIRRVNHLGVGHTSRHGAKYKKMLQRSGAMERESA